MLDAVHRRTRMAHGYTRNVIFTFIALFLPFMLAIACAEKLKNGPMRGHFTARTALLLAVASVPITVADLYLEKRVPFKWIFSELLLSAIAAVALLPLFLSVHSLDSGGNKRSNWIDFLIAPQFFLIMVIYMARVCYARELNWSCDGQIVAIYKSNNHGAITIAVLTDHDVVIFEGVDPVFWHEAAVGNHLMKPAGSAFRATSGKKCSSRV